jgi:deoxyribonuclease V
MILAVDVHYRDTHADIAGVSFQSWEQPSADATFISSLSGINKYIPGSFYKRELPCILKLLHEHDLHPECIVIDGYVFLDGISKPGLGKHLYDALDESISIVGVAKNLFKGIDQEFQIYRGKSIKPIYITAVGIPIEQARENIMKMHGRHRIPDILKSVDRICRGS